MAQSDRDTTLVQAMAQGDTRALDELYTRHGRRLLAYLVGLLHDRQLAEEVLQDVMLAAWRGASGFRGDSRVSTWLTGIARLQGLNALRRRGAHWLPLDDGLAVAEGRPGRGAGYDGDRDLVRAALRELPTDQRETLELIFYQELTGPEAARVLGVPEGTVKSRLSRAKTTLRRLLKWKEVG